MKIDENGNNNENNVNKDNYIDEDDTSMNKLIELMEFEKEQASSKLMQISGSKRRNNDDEKEWSTFKIPKIEPKSKKMLNTIKFSNYKLPSNNNHYHQHKIKPFQPTNLSIHKEQINGFSTDKA